MQRWGAIVDTINYNYVYLLWNELNTFMSQEIVSLAFFGKNLILFPFLSHVIVINSHFDQVVLFVINPIFSGNLPISE